MRVVVARARLHDHSEVVRGLRVAASVELGAGQGLADAPRRRLRVSRALQDLGGGGRAALAEQFHTRGVPRVHVRLVWIYGVVAGAFCRIFRLETGVAGEVFPLRGIPAAAWCF